MSTIDLTTLISRLCKYLEKSRGGKMRVVIPCRQWHSFAVLKAMRVGRLALNHRGLEKAAGLGATHVSNCSCLLQYGHMRRTKGEVLYLVL